MCCYSCLCVYCIQSVNQFVSLLNLDQWYQSGLLFIYFSLCMSLTRFGYKKLGLEPIENFQYWLCQTRQKPMGDENKDDGAGYPFKMLLKESLA
jgi:hypothetical protein